jgi:hypothetical protein
VHAGYLEKIGDVLAVVDLVEERLFVGIDIPNPGRPLQRAGKLLILAGSTDRLK